MAAPQPSRLHIVSRIAAALLGGYAFVWGFTTLGIALGLAAGMAYTEAQALFYLLAFIVFLGVFCWAFTAASLSRVWASLAGGGGVMAALAWLITRSML
jgi:hypothetical protein